jgi:hypothetical protein
MPLSPAANRRRAAASGQGSPMALLLMKVPSDSTDVRSDDMSARATEGDERRTLGGPG